MRKVFITGIGSISSLGLTVEEQLTSLRNARSGIGRATHFQSVYTGQLPFAEINASDEELKKQTECSELGVTRTTLIALKAFQEAVTDGGFSCQQLSNPRTAFISSSTVGGMCYTDSLYTDANNKGETSEFYASYEGSNHTLQIVKRYNLRGYTDTINTACSSSANAILLGTRLIQSGRADRAIVGGADCLLCVVAQGVGQYPRHPAARRARPHRGNAPRFRTRYRARNHAARHLHARCGRAHCRFQRPGRGGVPRAQAGASIPEPGTTLIAGPQAVLHYP